MKQTVTDAQRHMVLSVLTMAMAILRDDQPFDPEHVIFGRNFSVRPLRGSVGTEYLFENSAFPGTLITVFAEADPADPTADRTKVRQVPTAFTVWFNSSIKGIPRSTIEDLLPLDIGYWVDSHGNQQPGNDMGAVPPQVLLHGYRYRASALPASQFPVDVELAFGDPDPQATEKNAVKTPVLLGAILTRNYFELTPRQREKNPR
ncbi:hypothetical protein HHL14_17320 [Paraburkholderia sp. G-4-1-8]|uniref:Uncharacterized protein n=2 Tax=Paraburkholderia antibiotica TaxID=2728839 RepID=A0A7X9X6Z3_9BURK|nr:hypothetical protein [Paraburkholderia antibiotica]